MENHKQRPLAWLPSNIFVGFPGAISLILLGVLIGMLLQRIYYGSVAGTLPLLLSILVGGGLLVVFFFILFGSGRAVLKSPYFATSSLLLIALATGLGTFISQNLSQEIFTARYGSLSSFLIWAHLHDIFHSWWYVGLFILMAVSLGSISLTRPFSKAHLGFHLAHWSPIIILLGFWIDFFEGYRGLIQLQTGMSKNEALVYHRNTNSITDTAQLGFSIRLDSFSSANFDPDYKIQLWKNNAIWRTERDANGEEIKKKVPQMVAALPLKLQNTNTIYGTDIGFKLIEYYPDIYFQYAHPPYDSTTKANNPGMILEVSSFMGDQTVQLKAFDPELNSIQDPHFDTWLKFYWEIPDSITNTFSPLGEIWKGHDWIIIEGKTKKMIRITDHNVETGMVQLDSYTPLSTGNPNDGFRVKNLYPDGSLLQATPASRSDQWRNPVAKLNIWGGSFPAAKDIFLFPGQGNNRGFFMIPQSDYFLAFASNKDKETKYWKSQVSILDPSGQISKQANIQVNQPLYYKGYRFYQTDYDPKNPRYSGIGVSHVPGLYIVYAGFYLMMAGILIMFYFRFTGDGKNLLNI